jgi:hypothetical protein
VLGALWWLAGDGLEARDFTLPGPEHDVLRITVGGPWESGAVHHALLGAHRRLGRAECQRVFSDFADPAGRPLQRRLDELRRTAQEVLAGVSYRDGSRRPLCARPAVLALTVPGSWVVWVCPQFVDKRFKDPSYAEAALIHEVLHVLGLGENPPTSAAITHRVMARCGG